MNENLSNYPKMEYYHHVFQNSPMWNGKTDLTNKKVIVYMQMGLGDQIMFYRFIRHLEYEGAIPILYASKTLHKLFNRYQCLDKDDPILPDHDYHVLSLELPFLLKCPIPIEPYIHIKEKIELLEGKNIGIAWTGSPEYAENEARSCPLKHFKVLKGYNLFWLQPNFGLKYVEDCEDLELNGVELNDFYDTAKLINSVDLVISVDTAVLHLAGAMGKKGFGLINPKVSDARWNYLWYPSLKIIKKDWKEAFVDILNTIKGV